MTPPLWLIVCVVVAAAGLAVVTWLFKRTRETRMPFLSTYDVVFSYAFETDAPPKKRYLGQVQPRRCRFCGRGEKDTKFRDKCHVIAVGLGNRELFSHDECSECNNDGAKLETELCAWLALPRATARIRARKGRVKYRRWHGAKSSIESRPDDNQVRIEILEGEDAISLTEVGEQELLLKVEVPPASVVSACKAICRMALFTMPLEVLEGEAAHLRAWVRGEQEFLPQLYRVFLPGTGRRLVRLKLYRATTELGAPWLVQLDYSSVTLLLPLPGAGYHLGNPDAQPLPFVGISPYPPYIPTARHIECLADERLPAREESITIRYRSKVPVKQAETGEIEFTTMSPPSADATEAATAVATRAVALDGRATATGHVRLDSEHGEVLYAGIGEFVLSPDSVTIRSGVVTLVARPQDEKVAFDVADLTTVELREAVDALALQLALPAARALEFTDEEGQPLLWLQLRDNPAVDEAQLRKGLEVAGRIKFINEAFGVELKLPRRLEPEDARTLEILSSAAESPDKLITDVRGGVYLLPIDEQSVGYLERVAAGQVTSLELPVHRPFQLAGNTIRTGGYVLGLEGVTIAPETMKQVQEHFEGRSEAVEVPVSATKATYVFDATPEKLGL